MLVKVLFMLINVLQKEMCSVCCSNDLPGDPHMNKLHGALTEKPGFGTRCMEGQAML